MASTNTEESRIGAYMRILSRFAMQGNAGRVWEKLTELEESSENQEIPWSEMVNYPSKETLAVVATRSGKLAVLKALQMKEAPKLYFEIANLDGKRPLHEGVESEQLACVEYLVETVGVSVNSLKRADWTPLMLASTKSNPDMVRYLISHGSDVHFRNKDGWNAFHLACRAGNLEVVKIVYHAGHDIPAEVSKNGRSPLHTAGGDENQKSIQNSLVIMTGTFGRDWALCESEVDDHTAAALHGHSSVVRFLLEECGYSPEVCDASGHTPKMDATLAGHVEVARLLETH